MKPIRRFVLACVAGTLLSPMASTQEPPKPGPEHEKLKQLEGTWEAVIQFGGGESKGTMTYKMELGGLWLEGKFEGEFFGHKFQGKGLDTYDPNKKKYVSIWVDSMSTSPSTFEGTFDKDGKVLTQTGEGPGMDGKIQKMKTVTEHKDKDTMVFTMYNLKDGAEEKAMTITYKRK